MPGQRPSALHRGSTPVGGNSQAHRDQNNNSTGRTDQSAPVVVFLRRPSFHTFAGLQRRETGLDDHFRGKLSLLLQLRIPPRS